MQAEGAAKAQMSTLHRRDYGAAPSAAIMGKRAERAMREQQSGQGHARAQAPASAPPAVQPASCKMLASLLSHLQLVHSLCSLQPQCPASFLASLFEGASSGC